MFDQDLNKDNIIDFKLEKIDENIHSMIHNVINFVDNSSLVDSIDDHSASNQEKINKEIISLEGSFLSKSMESINDLSLKHLDKENKQKKREEDIDKNAESYNFNETDNETEDILSKFTNEPEEFFDLEDDSNKIFRNPKKKFSLIKLNSSYTNDNSFADDIKKISSSSQKGPKSIFFSQNNNQKNKEISSFSPKHYNQNLNFSKNTSFSTQDQLISINSDAEASINSNFMGSSIFSNCNLNFGNDKKSSCFKRQNSFNTKGKNTTNANSSLNLNSTNQSTKKSSMFFQENFLKDQNLSNLSYKQ